MCLHVRNKKHVSTIFYRIKHVPISEEFIESMMIAFIESMMIAHRLPLQSPLPNAPSGTVVMGALVSFKFCRAS